MSRFGWGFSARFIGILQLGKAASALAVQTRGLATLFSRCTSPMAYPPDAELSGAVAAVVRGILRIDVLRIETADIIGETTCRTGSTARTAGIRHYGSTCNFGHVESTATQMKLRTRQSTPTGVPLPAFLRPNSQLSALRLKSGQINGAKAATPERVDERLSCLPIGVFPSRTMNRPAYGLHGKFEQIGEGFGLVSRHEGIAI